MLVDLKQKSQVTIPQDIVARLGLRTGDKLAITEQGGNIVLTPLTVIPADQAWFYSKSWQEQENAAELDIEQGHVHRADSTQELLEDLGLDEA